MDLTTRECRLLSRALKLLEEDIERSRSIMLDLDNYYPVTGDLREYADNVTALNARVYDEWMRVNYEAMQERRRKTPRAGSEGEQ